MLRMRYIAIMALFALALASAGFAQKHASRTGFLTLTEPAQVGNVLLPAGEYQVTHRFSSTGHYTEFARITESNLGFEGSPTYQERTVVATADCTMQPLSAKADKTAIEKEGQRIARLEIKGEDVAHNF